MIVILVGCIIIDFVQFLLCCQQVLCFIDGGFEWLVWVFVLISCCYVFVDEMLLLEIVQSGLYVLLFILLLWLMIWISLVKLMILGLNDLDLLVCYEVGEYDDVLDVQIYCICIDYYLVDMVYLMIGMLGLCEFQLEILLLFQCMDFGELLVLVEIVIVCLMLGILLDVIKEVGVFVVVQVCMLVEFGDYLCLYVCCVLLVFMLEGCEQVVMVMMQVLLLVLFGVLDCLQVDGLLFLAEVVVSLVIWLQDCFVGFDCIFLVVQQVVVNMFGDFVDFLVVVVVVIVYLDCVWVFFIVYCFIQGCFVQDGCCGMFQIDVDGVCVVLQVDYGVVLLQFFGFVLIVGVVFEVFFV